MDQMNSAVAENLKSIRSMRNLSLEALSQLTGVSKSMLRQIEIGASNPTVSTIWKIANGLRLPFTSLVALPVEPVVIADFKANSSLHVAEKGYRVHPMIPFSPESLFEVYYVEIDGGAVFEGEPHGDNSVENIYVYQGSITINLGAEEFKVGPEQYISFRANKNHRYSNNGSERAAAVMQISYRV